MAKVSDLKNSKYLSKEDCGPQGLRVIITGWTQKDVSRDNEPDDLKYVLEFKGVNGVPLKPLVLNSTNGERIQAVTGSDDLDDWTGHEIVLYNDPDVMFAGKRVGGIRVYVPQKAPAVAQADYRGENPPPPTEANIPPEEAV